MLQENVFPINLELPISASCWDSYRLYCLLARSEYFPWFIDKFINLRLNGGFQLHHYSKEHREHIAIYDEVLSSHYVVSPTSKEELKQLIIKTIDHNSVGVFIQDRRILTNTNYDAKNQLDYLHDILIYGYNLPNDSFYYIDGVLHNKSREKYVNTTTFYNSFKSGYKILKDSFNYYSKDTVKINEVDDKYYWVKSYIVNGMPASILEFKNYSEDVNLVKLLYALEEYLNGGELINLCPNEKGKDYGKEWKGISIYKGYYNDFYEAIVDDITILDNITLWFFHILSDSKKSLIFKANYLFKTGLIEEVCSEWVVQITQLCDKISLAGNLLQKYRFSEDKEILKRSMQLIKESEQLDYCVIHSMKNIVLNALDRKLFNN